MLYFIVNANRNEIKLFLKYVTNLWFSMTVDAFYEEERTFFLRFLIWNSLLQKFTYTYNIIVFFTLKFSLQLGFFTYYSISTGEFNPTGPVPIDSIFIYRPDKRSEIWRFLFYMMLHAGWVKFALILINGWNIVRLTCNYIIIFKNFLFLGGFILGLIYSFNFWSGFL